ncbi:MAG: (deoxy)nucleoside triphosphate pyrophosphohydrolase [Cyclobacteriaceae bacterium]
MIAVTCAVIKENRLFLAVQRNANMKLPLKWEFPGGKLEVGESEEEGLIREIREELQLEIVVDEKLNPVLHDYGQFQIHLLPYLSHIRYGSLCLKEHQDHRWLEIHQLPELDWAEADIPVVRQLITLFGKI